MGILRHIWQALKDLANEIRGYRDDVRQARQQFRASNGLEALPPAEPPTEVIEIDAHAPAIEAPAEPAEKSPAKRRR
ncbi:MAG TPA: hypothetical protein VKS79_21325 [Gemmataceae bacterium]|nr:hypothetical protein [Gemmataceae bacterium]